MKKIIAFLPLLFMILCTSCYEDFVDDYNYSSTGFAISNPLRTVIADRGMEIRVGAFIAGKRSVDVNDWVKYQIDASLLNGTGMVLLPKNYYVIDDTATFRVSKANLPVADVGIKFTDAFYADPLSITKHYALPLRIVESSLDSINPGMKTTVVVIKYISTFHGTYYIKGNLYELNNANEIIDTTTYSNKDLINNITCDLTTLSTNVMERPGLANFVPATGEKVKLTFQNSDKSIKTYNVLVETAAGGIAITNGSGTYDGTKTQPEISLTYEFTKNAKKYRAVETLILRQDPLFDLRVETW